MLIHENALLQWALIVEEILNFIRVLSHTWLSLLRLYLFNLLSISNIREWVVDWLISVAVASGTRIIIAFAH